MGRIMIKASSKSLQDPILMETAEYGGKHLSHDGGKFKIEGSRSRLAWTKSNTPFLK
jgi:hypothetical protein